MQPDWVDNGRVCTPLQSLVHRAWVIRRSENCNKQTKKKIKLNRMR